MSVKQDAEIRRLKQQLKHLKKNYGTLLDQQGELQQQLDALLYIRDFEGTHKIIPKHEGGSEIACVAVLSDWHAEERILSKTVNGLNEYSLTIARSRAEHVFEMIVRLVKKEQTSNKVNCLVLALLGDFLTGSIHEENLETCQLRPIEAIIFVQELLASGIEYLLRELDMPLHIPCCNGN